MLLKCKGKAPLTAEVGKKDDWLRLWDKVLDLGDWQMRGMKALTRMLSHHGRGSKPCPLCDESLLAIPLFDYVMNRYSVELRVTKHDITSRLVEQTDLNSVYVFCNIYMYYNL